MTENELQEYVEWLNRKSDNMRLENYINYDGNVYFRFETFFHDGSSISSPIYEKDKAKVFDYCKKEFAKDIEKGFKPKYYTILKYSARPVGSLYKTTEIYKSEIMNY